MVDFGQKWSPWVYKIWRTIKNGQKLIKDGQKFLPKLFIENLVKIVKILLKIAW
jgi:hypothetical protein